MKYLVGALLVVCGLAYTPQPHKDFCKPELPNLS
jgi:hypothetical protein